MASSSIKIGSIVKVHHDKISTIGRVVELDTERAVLDQVIISLEGEPYARSEQITTAYLPGKNIKIKESIEDLQLIDTDDFDVYHDFFHTS